MRMFARYDEHGQYTWYGSAGTEPPIEGNGVHYGVVDPVTQYHDLVRNEPVNKPERPSPDHTFNYVTKQWDQNTPAAWARVRMDRDRLLAQTDWMVTKAVELGEPMASGWSTYRQALRDVTTQWDPFSIVWPTPPSN